MKIPNNAILAVAGVVGTVLTALSTYWIGRRVELNEIIDLGKFVEDEKDFRVLDMYDDKGKQVTLFIKCAER